MATTIFSLFLDALGVPHTNNFSDAAFRQMTFQSLFGFSRLMKSYGIDNEGYSFSDKSQISSLPLPCLVQRNGKFVVLKEVREGKAYFSTPSGNRCEDETDFIDSWTGIALVAYPDRNSHEPDLGQHRLMETAVWAKRLVLWAGALFLFLFAYIHSGSYTRWWTTAVILFDISGIYISWQLVLKSMDIHTKAASRICGVIDQGGCDTVLKQKASSFFGIFGWSEVGLAYFSVSALALLIFPDTSGWLAAINVCCLPFSFWSVWYQKTRAKAWCTMCLTVQALLWLIFFCNLAGGAFRGLDFDSWTPWVLIAAYATTLTGINAITQAVKQMKR